MVGPCVHRWYHKSSVCKSTQYCYDKGAVPLNKTCLGDLKATLPTETESLRCWYFIQMYLEVIYIVALYVSVVCVFVLTCMGENELGCVHTYGKSKLTLFEFLYNSTSYIQSQSSKEPEVSEFLLVLLVNLSWTSPVFASYGEITVSPVPTRLSLGHWEPDV